MKISQEQLDEIVKKHGLWLKNEASGSRANLSEADLSGANLSRADLSEASMTAGIKIVSVSGIGSSRRLTNYRVDTDEVWCGCFKGTLAEFADEVKNTHKDNPQRLADYEAAIVFFKAAKKSFDAMNKESEK